jgi:hypothetical protein
MSQAARTAVVVGAGRGLGARNRRGLLYWWAIGSPTHA